MATRYLWTLERADHDLRSGLATVSELTAILAVENLPGFDASVQPSGDTCAAAQENGGGLDDLVSRKFHTRRHCPGIRAAP